MFSSRFCWDLRPNRLAELLQAKRREGAAILDLTESNPTRAGIAYPSEAILQAFADPGLLVYDPAPAGSLEARKAIADYYASRNFIVDPQRILLTASTSEGYAYLFKLLANPGDEILVPRPSYPLFEYLATMESLKVAQYPLIYHGAWSIDFDSLSRAINSRTRAIILVNPNNPTGSFIKEDELKGLVQLAQQHALAIVSDEVFGDYTLGLEPRRAATLVNVSEVLTFCLSGLSKVIGLPQMKLAWIVVGGPGAARTEALEKLELIADTYLSVSTPVQRAAPRLLIAGAEVREQISQRVHGNLKFLKEAAGSESPCQILSVEGGWYTTLRVPRTRSEEEWALQLLDADSVLVQPGFFYDFEEEAFLVVSLLTESPTFREGIRRLLARLDGEQADNS